MPQARMMTEMIGKESIESNLLIEKNRIEKGILSLKRKISELECGDEFGLKRPRVSNQKKSMSTSCGAKDANLPPSDCNFTLGCNRTSSDMLQAGELRNLHSTAMKNGLMTPSSIGDKSLRRWGVQVSPFRNSHSFLKGGHLTWKRYSLGTIQQPLTLNKLNPSERDLRSPYPSQPQLTVSELMETGVSPLISGSKPLLSSCLGRKESYTDTSDTSPAFSSMSTTAFTPELSTLIKPVGLKSKAKNIFDLTQSSNSDALKSHISHPSEWLPIPNCNIFRLWERQEIKPQEGVQVVERGWDEATHHRASPVTTGIVEHATNPLWIVCGSTSVTSAEGDTSGRNVLWQQHLNESIAQGQRFRRKLVWGERANVLSGTAIWSETAEPLPRPPPSEFTNAAVNRTLSERPDLFHVSTPINVDWFESLLTLANHPNPSFVHSVCQGLWEGLWPWANTQVGVHPITWDIPSPTPSTETERAFIRSQIHKEESVGRYSPNFGPYLLPACRFTQCRKREASIVL